MKRLLGIFLFSVFVTHSLAKEPTKAELLFERCARGMFLNEPTRTQIVAGGLEVPFISSGHTAQLDDGALVSFERLAYQAEVIAKEGRPASEEAFKHLEDEMPHMRVIAFAVLVRIAGKAPKGYYFARPGGEFEGNKKWREDAKLELRKLDAEHAAPSDGDQPPN